MVKITESFPMADWEQMHSFIVECYREDHILCSRDFFEWQFQANRKNGDATVICGWDNDKLMGILGYTPLSVFWGEVDNPEKAVWLLHWIVRKQSPHGLGWLLVKRIQDMFPLSLTVNTSEKGGPLLQRLGWTYYSRIPRHVFVIDKQRCVNMLSPDSKESDLDEFLLKSEISGPSKNGQMALNEANYKPEWSLYPHLNFGTVRSLDYLNWRYLDHPVFDYRVMLEGSPHRPAVCIFRIENAFGSYKAKVGRLVDFYFPNDAHGVRDGTAVIRSVFNYLKNAECAYADFICSNKFCSELIRTLGGGEESERKQVLPSRLAPIQHLFRHQNFAFLDSKAKITPECNDLYVTKADIDGDSPAGISEEIRGRIGRQKILDFFN